jgi:hypothetical protein
MRLLLTLILVCIFLVACAEKDQTTPPITYSLQVGDTLFTFPDSAVRFAQDNFSVHAYLLREFQVGSSQLYPHQGSRFLGSLGQWSTYLWQYREPYLSPPYNRDVKITDQAQYYYEIGTYIAQFGYGWLDTFSPTANLLDPNSNPWAAPADTSLTHDDPSTIGFDGTSNAAATYRRMWTYTR